MNKKKRNILILFGIILTICILIVIFIINTNNSNFIVNETSNCDNVAKLYYQYNNQKIYTYCLDKVEVIVDDKKTELKEYLKSNGIDDLINKLEKESTFDDGGTTIYKDGGTKKITGNGLTLIKCNTLEGNNDIYIGNKDMEFKLNFCKNDNRTFTRTYTIKKVENYAEQQYENGVPVTYGKSLSVTLSQFQGETKTVIINNLWDELIENQTYEFEFILNGDTSDIEDNIKSIFKNSTIVEVRSTKKEGLSQRQDAIN